MYQAIIDIDKSSVIILQESATIAQGVKSLQKNIDKASTSTYRHNAEIIQSIKSLQESQEKTKTNELLDRESIIQNIKLMQKNIKRLKRKSHDNKTNTQLRGKRYIIYGNEKQVSGALYNQRYNLIKYGKPLCVINNDETKWGEECCGLVIQPPQKHYEYPYDCIVIAASKDENEEINLILHNVGVSPDKINKLSSYTSDLEKEADTQLRSNWVTFFAKHIAHIGVSGNVAECGVYRGNFASVLNKVFNTQKLYLFDSFEEGGFCDRDMAYYENCQNERVKWVLEKYNSNSIDDVMAQMTYPENVIIKKGWVPDTFVGVDDTFCFVNLDMDMYDSTLHALRFFYPRMNPGGGILLHDYYGFDENNVLRWPGVKQAVQEFEQEVGKLSLTPVGNSMFLAKH